MRVCFFFFSGFRHVFFFTNRWQKKFLKPFHNVKLTFRVTQPMGQGMIFLGLKFYAVSEQLILAAFSNKKTRPARSEN